MAGYGAQQLSLVTPGLALGRSAEQSVGADRKCLSLGSALAGWRQKVCSQVVCRLWAISQHGRDSPSGLGEDPGVKASENRKSKDSASASGSRERRGCGSGRVAPLLLSPPSASSQASSVALPTHRLRPRGTPATEALSAEISGVKS